MVDHGSSFHKVNELHLFAGCGGGILGGMLLGHTCVCAVEIDAYCRKVLLQRQRDGILPRFPIWDDVRTFDGKPWRELVDVVCGGFPCQDISVGNSKGKGIRGARSGLWFEMLRIVCEVRPRVVFVENTSNIIRRGMGEVLRGLAENGYDAIWGVFSASGSGLWHKRERMFIYAHSNQDGLCRKNGNSFKPNKNYSQWLASEGCENWRRGFDELVAMDVVSRISTYSEGVRALNGISDRVDRLGAVGNAQVPIVAATAFQTLSKILQERLK